MKGSNIVLATDLSDNAGYAAEWAHDFAKDRDISVIVTHVVSNSVSNWAKGDHDVLDDPEMMEKAEQTVVDWYSGVTGDEPDSVRVLVGRTAIQLAETVESLEAKMLVLSTSGKGAVKKFFVGSTAQSVANDPPCPVVIVEPEHAKLHDSPRIVVGTDFSENASKALSFGAHFTRMVGGKLDIVHADTMPVINVIDTGDLPANYVDDGHYEWAREELTKVLDAHKDELEGIDYDAHVIEEAPAKGLLDFVKKEDADVVIIGRSGHSKFTASVIGSVVLKALHSKHATTIVVPDH